MRRLPESRRAALGALYAEARQLDSADTRARWRRMELLAEMAEHAFYNHDDATDAEIGAEIAALIRDGAGADIARKADEWQRNDDLRGMFLTMRARGETGVAARAELAAMFCVGQDVVRKVIRETPAEYWQDRFPELDAAELAELLRR